MAWCGPTVDSDSGRCHFQFAGLGVEHRGAVFQMIHVVGDLERLQRVYDGLDVRRKLKSLGDFFADEEERFCADALLDRVEKVEVRGER